MRANTRYSVTLQLLSHSYETSHTGEFSLFDAETPRNLPQLSKKVQKRLDQKEESV